MSQNKAWQKGHGPHCSKQSLTVGIDVACLDSDFKVVELYSRVLSRWIPRILLAECIGEFGFSLFFS